VFGFAISSQEKVLLLGLGKNQTKGYSMISTIFDPKSEKENRKISVADKVSHG